MSPEPIRTEISAVQERLVTSVTEAKQFLGIDPLDTSQDLIIKIAIDAGKQLADAYMGNPFLRRATTTFDDLVYWEGNSIRDNDPVILDPKRAVGRSRYSRSGHVLPQKYESPEVELDIPDMIKLGVYRFVELTLEGPTDGVASERIGDWQRTYVNQVAQTDRAAALKQTYWGQWRLIPGL